MIKYYEGMAKYYEGSWGDERMTKDRWGEGGWRRYDEGLAGGDMTRGQPALISGKGGKGREGGSG